MGPYHLLLAVGYLKILQGIIACDLGMVVSVKLVPVIMPVIKKIIMQHANTHKIKFIYSGVKPPVYRKGSFCNINAVVISRYVSMLDEILHP